jgi:hypothetical protein
MPGRGGTASEAESVVWRPSSALRGLVDECRGYRYSLGVAGTHRGLPSSAMTVVIAFEEPLDVGWHDQPGTAGPSGAWRQVCTRLLPRSSTRDASSASSSG